MWVRPTGKVVSGTWMEWARNPYGAGRTARASLVVALETMT